MTTRTLGIKYEIRGFKEAIESLKSLNLGIKKTQAAEQDLAEQQIQNNKNISTSEESRVKLVEKTNQRILFSYLSLRKRIKDNFAVISNDFTKSVEQKIRKIKIDFKDYTDFNYGNTRQRQRVIIKQERQDFRQRQTYQGLNRSSRNRVIENRLLFREFGLDIKRIINQDLRQVLEETNQDNSGFFSGVKELITSPIAFSIDALLFPFQSAVAGAFERLGEVQTEDFAIGFSKKLQKSFGLPFDELGGDIGIIFGQGLNRVYESILKRSKEAIISDLDDKSPQIQNFVEDLKKIITGTIIQALAVPVKAHKRIQLRKKAVPKTKEAIGQRINNQEFTPEEISEIKKNDSITILTGGVNMDSTASNTDFVERLLRNYLDDTYIASVKNVWSNNKIGDEYKQVLISILKKIIDNPNAKQAIEQQFLEKGLIDDINKQNRKLGKSEIDAENLLENLLELAENEDLPLIKLLETAYEGYNRDDINIAAEAAFLKEKFPDKKINIIGTSAGGFNAAGALEILNQLGYDDIKAAGITTPATGLEFTGNAEDYLVSIGTQDEMYKGLMQDILNDSLPTPDFMQVVEKAGRGHLLPTFLGNEEFQKRFAEFFQGRIKIKEGINPAQMGFLSRLAQDPQYGDILRTFKGAFGEEVEEGYQFNADDLQGFKDYDLSKKIKKAKKGGNSEIHEIADEYEDFIDTLIDELRKGVKPLKSLQKAVKFYPELNELAQKQTASFDNQEIIEAYNKQLQAIITNANNRAKELINEENVDIDLEQVYNSIRQKISEYRQGIANSAAQTARELGEELLAETEFLKELWSTDKDPRIAQLTRIQNEIISGDKGKGRSPIGLANLPFTPGAIQLEIDFESTGEQAAEGFRQGLNENTEEVAQEFTEQIIDSTEEGFDIQSPSRRFFTIGSLVAEGFRQGVRGIRNFFEEEVEGLDEILDQPGVNNSVDNFFAEIITNVSDFFSELDQSFPMLARIRSAAMSVAGVFLQIIGISSLGSWMLDLATSGLQVASMFESIERSIISASGSFVEGAKNLKFVNRIVEDLDIDLRAAQESYSKLLGASRNTPLQGEQINNIFEAFSETASIRGLSDDASSRMFMAIEQAIAKGELRAEEVRGQLSEVIGDIQPLLASALGVNLNQLDEMMEDGISSSQALPKLAAQIKAQNALLASSAPSAQKLQTRYDNSLTQLQNSIGKRFQPIQKLILDWGSRTLEFLEEKIATLVTGAISLFLTVLVGLTVQLFTTTTASALFSTSISKLIGLLNSALPKILIFLKRFILVHLLVSTIGNIISLIKDPFPDMERGAEKLTLGLERLKRAYEEVNESSKKLKPATNSNAWEIDKGWKLPDNKLGNFLKVIAGGDRLNLDNFARKRLQNLEISVKTGIRDLANNFGLEGLANRYNRRLNNPNFLTEAERQENDFKVYASEITLKTNKIIEDSYKALEAAKEINKLDAQIAEIQSQRLDLLPHDQEALQESLKKEKAIQKERDKYLKILTQEQQNLQLAISINKNNLETLEQKYLGQEKDSTFYRLQDLFTGNIEDSDKKLKEINQEISQLSKATSEFQRRLRNANERVAGFMENRDRAIQQQRTQIITQGLEQGKGEQVVQLEIEQLETKDLSLRIKEIGEELAKINQDLRSPELAEGVRRVTESASSQGLELTTETLNRMLDEERDNQEKEALKALVQIRNLESQLFQFQEQAAQNIQQSRNSLIDFNRTVSDYFFNLGQRIKEAQLETERLIKQIFYQDIKSQLRRAIAPGSESFINGIIDGVQSLLDQAQQIFEQKLGLKSSKLQFESEMRSNDQEMRDFIRQVRGATDALLDFRNNLNNRRTTDNKTVSSNAVSFPLSGLTLDSATITSGFGWRNIFGRKDFHEGIDIAASGGTDVIAVRSGVVKHIKPLADQMQVGIESINDAGDRVMEWFIHLGQKLNVAVGDRVSPGQKIGEVAHTSAYARKQQVSTGDHLDYRAKVNGQWVDPKTLLVGADQGTVKFEISKPGNVSTDQIRSGNEAFNSEKLEQLDLQEIFNSYGLTDLEAEVNDQQEKIKRQFQIEELQKTNQFADLLDKLANLQEQSVIPNVDVELQRELRQVASEFRNIKFEGLQEVQKFADELATIKGVIEIFPDAIAKIQSSGSAEALAVLPVFEQILSEAQTALPQVQDRLKETSNIYKAIADEEAKRVAFIEEQGKLKKQLESLGKQEELQQLRNNIVLQRGTNEQTRQNELSAERIRLEKRIAEIKQQHGDTDQASELIKLEERNSAIAVENINREAYNRDLGYEQELLNLNSGMEDRKAESARSRGFDLEANKIQRENAIAQEYFRYDQEIYRLEQEYAGDPERLERLKQAASELSKINLASIDEQFKDLGGTIEDLALSEFQGFFSSLVSDIQNVGDLALKMIGNIAQSIGQIFAKRAASQIFGLIFKSAVGFRDGGTVENYEEGGTVERIVPTSISDRLQELSAPIRNAFRREGSGGRLAVFTPGEEILSIKTGEAGRYQELKRQLGINPLEKIFEGNFLDGGTIEANLLAGLDYSIPTINVGAIEGRERVSQPNTTQVYNLSSTFVTPDVDSFKASEYQIQQEQLEQLIRMNGRS